MPAIKGTTVFYPSASALSGNVVSGSFARSAGQGLLCGVYQAVAFASVGSASAPVWDAAGDNQTFTLLAAQQESTENRKLSLFYLAEPTTVKTGLITSTLSGGYGGANSHENGAMFVTPITGHDVAAMIREFNARSEPNAPANGLTNTIPSAVGDLVVFTGSHRDDVGQISAGDLSGYEEATSANANMLFVGTKPGAASVTGTPTTVNSTAYSCALIAVSIREGAVPPPVITGPTGAAGAASSTFNLAENAATGPLFSTDVALGSGYPTLTGAASSAYTLVSVGANQWRANPVSPFNFDSLTPANPHALVFNASASVSQTTTGTITNVAEGATFAGTLSVPTQTVGVAMSAINVASYFTAVDAGDTGTYSLDGGAIPGLTVSSNGLTFGGTVSASGSYTGRRIARLGSNGVTSYSNTFTVTANAGSGDTTVPTLTGAITVTAITATGYNYSHPAGSDNVGVASYERSVDGGATWSDVGNVLSGSVSGRTPGSVDPLRIRAKDANGNVSTPALAASVPLDVYKCSILDWVLPSTSQHAIAEPWNISFHNVSTRALVAYLPSQALVAGLNGAGQASRNLVAGSAAFAQGATYAWLATHPTNATWFSCGLATAA